MMHVTDSEISEVLTLLREISERPRCNRVKLAALVAIAWAMGALMGTGL
jgi:hypothetical protein